MGVSLFLDFAANKKVSADGFIFPLILNPSLLVAAKSANVGSLT